MNDRYLYKAKRKDNGEWVEGCLLIDYVTGQYFIHAYGNSVNESAKIGEEGCLRFVAFDVEPSTICQCTGIKDRNSELIWENDIVSAWSEGANAIGNVKKRQDGLYIMYPAYQKQEFWGLCPDESGRTTVEVIGNIFDNLELLKGENNHEE